MTDALLHHGEWVVVADGARALIFENTGPLNAPKLVTRENYAEKHPPTHALGTDAPGRAMNSAGPGRGAVPQTDWHDRAEQAFLEAVIKRLDGLVASGKAKSLIVVAPPRALKVLRNGYSKALRAAVKREIDKDLVKLPVPEIEKHLS
ncbi:MAG: host attachment protein [Pseudolabrys sp.]|nr:host attachment protein [Pseudolabrys sp.]MBV9260346.1 host attachment protein [Pseudolabrys sp.]